MGLLDAVKAIIGGNSKDLQEKALQSMLENVLGKNSSAVSDILKNVDMSKAGELVDFFQKNGFPDTKEEIEELIGKLTKSEKKPATKK